MVGEVGSEWTWSTQVLLRQMEGCRLPIANIVEPPLGGGNSEGSYGTMVEVFNTPDGYLADCPYPPGGEVDVLIISDSSLLSKSPLYLHYAPYIPLMVGDTVIST